MKRVFAFIRFIPILVFCTFLGIAFARVNEAERGRANVPQLPTPVGQLYSEPSFATKVGNEMGQVWLEFYSAVLPGLVPAPEELKHQNPNSLDALKLRTTPRSLGSYAPVASY